MDENGTRFEVIFANHEVRNLKSGILLTTKNYLFIHAYLHQRTKVVKSIKLIFNKWSFQEIL